MEYKILVVDDEKKIANVLSEKLRLRGFDATPAYDGKTALEHIAETDFDVVLLDVLMPEMDGIETLKKIKKIKPAVEVIMLTGHASVEVGIEGMKSGAFNYIIKPFDPHELLTEINLACEHRYLIKKGN